jgi:ribonuclease HII
MSRTQASIATRVAGVDEAGRGPLAGPLVVAAVILDPARPIAGLGDSKQIAAPQRERLHDRIIEQALAFRIEVVDVPTIDTRNILRATLEAMARCIAGLDPAPELVLIDGNRLPPGLALPARAIVDGDATEAAIGAASIIAKVTRDRLMVELDAVFPGYGFARHKGYGTPEHLTALTRLGPCAQHRLSFAPVRDRIAPKLAL